MTSPMTSITRRDMVAAGILLLGGSVLPRGAFADEQAQNFSFLDGMTSEQLQSVIDEAQRRIDSQTEVQPDQGSQPLQDDSGQDSATQDTSAFTFSPWTAQSYKDHYGNETDSKFVYAQFSGTYTDKKTTDGFMSFDICVETTGEVRFVFMDASTTPFKGSSGSEIYEGTVTAADGSEDTISGTYLTTNLWLDKASSKKVTDALDSGGDITFHLANTGGKADLSFDFVASSNGFQEAYASIEGAPSYKDLDTSSNVSALSSYELAKNYGLTVTDEGNGTIGLSSLDFALNKSKLVSFLNDLGFSGSAIVDQIEQTSQMDGVQERTAGRYTVRWHVTKGSLDYCYIETIY